MRRRFNYSTTPYETYVSPDGTIAIPPIPEYHDRKVFVSVHAEREERNPPALTDEEKRQQRIAAEKARIMDRTPEEREAAMDGLRKFAGCLKDMPGKELVSKKQIRSARLEENTVSRPRSSEKRQDKSFSITNNTKHFEQVQSFQLENWILNPEEEGEHKK